MRVLSIDAWCDGQTCIECGYHKLTDTTKGTKVKCESCLNEQDEDEGKQWFWNNWFHIADWRGQLDKQKIFNYLYANHINPKYTRSDFEIEDDQHNLVLIESKSRRPLFAIEYGTE